jgi:hypothetical protein
MRSLPSVARLKVTLDEVEPVVIRRLEVPLDLRRDRLHLVRQAALGWTNSHLWEFRARDIGWGIPDPAEWDRGSGPRDARKATLLRVIEDTGAKTLTYLYDFGDGTIKIERAGPGDPAATYPRLLEALGHCPPEDVGGPPGYEEFLAEPTEPGHERHAEIVERHGENFDPHAVDPTEIERALANIARRWSRPRSVKPT